MNLYLIRHGIAVEPGGQPDSARELTVQGRIIICQIARALHDFGLSPDLIMTSPYIRARQTAELLAGGLGITADKVIASKHLTPSGNPAVLLKALRAETAVLVGHEPYLSDLASVLLTGKPGMKITLKKGGICILSADKLCYGCCAALESLLPPKLLLATGQGLP